jgi:hypothetical protein
MLQKEEEEEQKEEDSEYIPSGFPKNVTLLSSHLCKTA